MKYEDYFYPTVVYKKMLKDQMEAATKAFAKSGHKFWSLKVWKNAFEDAYNAGDKAFDEYDEWEKWLNKL